jgi:replicative DNA helicase
MSRLRFDSEGALLGACLIDPKAFWKVADLVAADDLSTDTHRAIWKEISALQRAGSPADYVTVAERLPHLVGELAHLSNNTPGSTNVRSYAEFVSRVAIERRVRAAGERIAHLHGDDALTEAQHLIGGCQRRTMTAVRPIGDFLRQAVVIMQQRCDSDNEITGLPTSLDWLDEQTGGWQPGDLIVLAARPSVGKTALMLQIANHAAALKKPTFIASMEQSGAQLADRLLAHRSGVSLTHIMQPKRIQDTEWLHITNAGTEIEPLQLLIDETGGVPLDALCARIRQVHAEHGIALALIDYLQQIALPKADKVADAIQIVTRTLKALAKELQIPLILLSQLNREGEDRPVLRNLRDSGAIEQDADIVIFLHRPDQQNRKLVELIIGKQRNGPTESVYLESAMSKMRFSPTNETPAVRGRSWGHGSARPAAAQGSDA